MMLPNQIAGFQIKYISRRKYLVYLFTCWYQKLRVNRKILEWCVARNGCGHPGHKVNGCIIKLIFHADENSRKLRIIDFNNFWVAAAKKVRVWDSNFNEWINLAEILQANTYFRKLKVTLIIIGWAWLSMGVSF